MAQRAIDQPRRRLATIGRQLAERELEFVDAVVPRLVHARRLARRADEQTRKQIGEGRMVVPVGRQAAQEVRTPQERAVERRAAAQHEVVAPACARVTPVEHEFLGRQARLMRLLIQRRGLRDQIVPAGAGLHVDLDDAGIRRD
jgi:hypothetical protein